MSDRFQSFAEFWPFYVTEHSDPRNRALHFVGTTLGFVVLTASVYSGIYWLLIPAIAASYAFAWIGHFKLEKNVPATFTYPVWSFRADMRMWRLTLFGKMQAEVDRHAGTARP